MHVLQVDCTAVNAVVKGGRASQALSLVHLEGSESVAVQGAGGVGIYTAVSGSGNLREVAAVAGGKVSPNGLHDAALVRIRKYL